MRKVGRNGRKENKERKQWARALTIHIFERCNDSSHLEAKKHPESVIKAFSQPTDHVNQSLGILKECGVIKLFR